MTRYITVILDREPDVSDIPSHISETLKNSYYDSITELTIKELGDTFNFKSSIVRAKTPEGKEYLTHIINDVESEEIELYQNLKTFFDTYSEDRIAQADKTKLFIPEDKLRTRPCLSSTNYLEKYPTESFDTVISQICHINRYRIFSPKHKEITTWYDILKTIATIEDPYLLILKGSSITKSIPDPSLKQFCKNPDT